MNDALQKERSKLEEWTRPGRQWWVIRISLLYVLLNTVPEKVFPWGPLGPATGAILLYGAVLLMWWMVTKAMESERLRVLQKRPRRFWDGWHGLSVLLVVPFAFRLFRLSGFPQKEFFYLLMFVGYVFLMEQGFSAKRTSFELLEARDQALRAKLAPHFIFNTLNTLHAQIERDPKGAQDTTEKLAHLFRQVVEVADRPTIPLREELSFVEAYLGIEKARFGERLRVRVEVPEELEAYEIPPLSLQVLVENAIKHGISRLESGGEVAITARQEPKGLRLEVTDPGGGTSSQSGTGTALETLRRRLARPEDLSLDPLEQGFRASLLWRSA